MEFLQRFCFGNYILSVSLLSWLTAQIIKTVLNYLANGKFEAERLVGAGGMPSSHSALVCSMFIATAKKMGVTSPAFAFAFILAAIVMYDAMGVRCETGEQAKVINLMVNDWLSEDEDATFLQNVKKLKEKVGHTPFEVLGGALLGILIAVIIPVM